MVTTQKVLWNSSGWTGKPWMMLGTYILRVDTKTVSKVSREQNAYSSSQTTRKKIDLITKKCFQRSSSYAAVIGSPEGTNGVNGVKMGSYKHIQRQLES